jgi:ribonuclease VapC
LDTSAILALLEDEAGADRVQSLLRSETVLLPFLVSLEVYYISFQEKGEETANLRYSLLKALRATHLNEVSEPVLLTAGRLKASYPISLAAAIIAALALRRGAVLVHKDPEYEALKDLLRLEALPPPSPVGVPNTRPPTPGTPRHSAPPSATLSQ